MRYPPGVGKEVPRCVDCQAGETIIGIGRYRVLVDRAALTEALDIAETRECICTLEECKCERLDEMRKLVKAKLG